MLSGAFAVQHHAVQIKYYYNSRVDLLQKHSLEFQLDISPILLKLNMLKKAALVYLPLPFFFTVNFNLSVENI